MPVPDLRGLTQDQAANVLQASGYRIGEVDSRTDDTLPAGQVIASNPPAGDAAPADSTVALTLSAGPARVALPNLVGLTAAAAQAVLDAAGLRSGRLADRPHDSIAPGQVVGSDPAPGAAVEPGAEVRLHVSTGPANPPAPPPDPAPGPAPVRNEVPDLTGLSRTAAESRLRAVGLAIGRTRRSLSVEVPADGVVSTVPPAGAMASDGKVDLLLSTGQPWPPAAILSKLGYVGLAVAVLMVIARFLWGDTGLLSTLQDPAGARGVITFLIVIVTIAIALILTLSTIMLESDAELDKRFDRGKQVLSTMMGVVGTIVGFYFGQASTTTVVASPPGIQSGAVASLPAATVGTAYSAPPSLPVDGLTPPLAWALDPAPPAGLTLDPTTGTISGTPAAAQAATTYVITASEKADPSKLRRGQVSLEVKGRP